MKKNESEFISIIIPCYNVEKYIEKCTDSIFNETYKNFEIILVDDCSTDNTYKILCNIKKKHKNVSVLKNEKNSGAGYSRNQGIKASKYDIISFIDSDDYIEQNYHEELLKSMNKEKSDIAVCDIYVKYDKSFGKTMTDGRSIACNGEVNKYNIVNNGLAASPCNKLFKKELLLNNLFPEGIMNEDIATVIGCILDANKISYTDKTYYSYYQRKTSVQNEKISMKRFDIFKSIEILENRKAKEISKNKDIFDALIYNQVIMFFVYVIPKETNFFYRYKLLKKFNQLSHKYKIRQNHLLWDFLESLPKKSKWFYKAVLKANCNSLYFTSDCLFQIYRIHKFRQDKSKSKIKDNIGMNDLIEMAKKQKDLKENNFSISVVIPNYNYERYMYQRIYSILYQKIKINELIILDDCSSDNSRELIDKIVEELSKYINIKKVYNKTNSGSAFKQWRKGFELAKSDYVWIAEADDYCDKNFLKSITKPLKKFKDIVISYSDTAFINNDGYIIMNSIKTEIDVMKTGHWNHNFIDDGVDEIKKYSFLNCTIANVSSVLFKNDNYDDFFEESGKYKQAGDWLFYNNVMSKGKISYIDKPLNYYRVHGDNVTSLTKKQNHFDEIKRVHKYFDEKYKFNAKQNKEINLRYKFLRKVWKVK